MAPLRFRPSALHRLPIFRHRTTRLVTLLTLICVLIYQYSTSSHHEITSHEIDFAASHLPDPKNASAHHGFLPLTDATTLCATQHWTPWPQRDIRRKVYSLFMLNDELDMLEIHLSTLYDYVDYFIIVESPVTFTNLPKPLVLKDNWTRVQKWEDKIIHHILKDIPTSMPRTWDYEDFQRNAMFMQTFPFMSGEKEPRNGDVLLVTDVDEIIRPATAMLLRECITPRRLTLRSKFFYYSFQWQHVGPQWPLPKATTFSGLTRGSTISPQDLRNGEGGWRVSRWWEKDELWNAGWHCSTCFRSVGEVLNKMSSFSHTSLNQEGFRDRTRIVDRVRKGMDLWDRKGEVYERVETGDVPDVLKGEEGRKRWGYLLDRDGVNAGFEDVDFGYVPGD